MAEGDDVATPVILITNVFVLGLDNPQSDSNEITPISEQESIDSDETDIETVLSRQDDPSYRPPAGLNNRRGRTIWSRQNDPSDRPSADLDNRGFGTIWSR